MQEKNGLLKKRDIAHQFKTQQGNTLVPVIIALAISMVSTLGFIKQGNNLSNTTNQLLAQNEITKLIGHWNSLKTIKAKKDMDEKNDFPDLSENTYGLRQIFLSIIQELLKISCSYLFMTFPQWKTVGLSLVYSTQKHTEY